MTLTKPSAALLSLVFVLSASPQVASAQACRDIFNKIYSNGFAPELKDISRAELHRKPVEIDTRVDRRPYLSDKRASQLIAKAKEPHKQGEFGPRLITDEIGETPDIDKPVWVTLPDGSRSAFFGLSGQQYLLVNSIDRLAKGGLVRPHTIKLLNESGHPYGADFEKASGDKIPYALDSSTWDASAVQAFNERGQPTLKILAGALANGGNGKPLLIRQKDAAQTRRRVVFHQTEWFGEPGNWQLVASQPKSPFFDTVLRDGSWSRFDHDGNPIMIHSYGGGAVKLANGESYADTFGNIHWAGDGVFDVRRVIGAKANEWKYTPYHSGMYMAKLDPTLNSVVEAPHVVLNSLKENGSVFREAERPGIGPLVEGGHIEPRVILRDGSTRAIRSNEDLAEIRKLGLREYMIMVGSQGRYDRDYGSFQAIAKPGTTDFKMVVDQKGELINLTSDFNVLTYATGRPVIVYGESGQAYMLWHADARIDYTTNLKDLSRQIWIAPVKLNVVNGVETYTILDNTGLMNELRRHKPKPLKEKMR